MEYVLEMKDIQLGSVGGRVNAVLQLDQTGILQQKQCAGLVGAVVRAS